MSRPDTPRRAQHGGECPIDSTLRDRKKAKQRTELLRAALDLFRVEGFEKTRMEDIAARAVVSTPTVYNYFASKRDVLIALLREDRQSDHEPFERLVRNPPPEPADAFAALIYENFRNIREPEEKRLWREMIAAVALTHDREDDPFDKNHDIVKGYIKRLLVHYIKHGLLLETISIDLAADVIFAINSHNLRRLVASPLHSPERIRAISRDQFTLIISDWRARAEPQRKTTTDRTGKRPRRSRLS